MQYALECRGFRMQLLYMTLLIAAQLVTETSSFTRPIFTGEGGFLSFLWGEYKAEDIQSVLWKWKMMIKPLPKTEGEGFGQGLLVFYRYKKPHSNTYFTISLDDGILVVNYYVSKEYMGTCRSLESKRIPVNRWTFIEVKNSFSPKKKLEIAWRVEGDRLESASCFIPTEGDVWLLPEASMIFVGGVPPEVIPEAEAAESLACSIFVNNWLPYIGIIARLSFNTGGKVRHVLSDYRLDHYKPGKKYRYPWHMGNVESWLPGKLCGGRECDSDQKCVVDKKVPREKCISCDRNCDDGSPCVKTDPEKSGCFCVDKTIFGHYDQCTSIFDEAKERKAFCPRYEMNLCNEEHGRCTALMPSANNWQLACLCKYGWNAIANYKDGTTELKYNTWCARKFENMKTECSGVEDCLHTKETPKKSRPFHKISIGCKKNCEDMYQSNRLGTVAVNLHRKCLYKSSSEYDVTLHVTKPDGTEYPTSGFKFNVRPAKAEIIIPVNTLTTPGPYWMRAKITHYRFREIFTYSNNITTEVPSPPYGGNCAVSPAEGEALLTSFEIRCTGWKTGFTSVTAFTYEVYNVALGYYWIYIGKDEANVGEEFLLTKTLSLGDERSGFSTKLGLSISDIPGSTTKTEVVAVAKTVSEDQLKTLLEGMQLGTDLLKIEEYSSVISGQPAGVVTQDSVTKALADIFTALKSTQDIEPSQFGTYTKSVRNLLVTLDGILEPDQLDAVNGFIAKINKTYNDNIGSWSHMLVIDHSKAYIDVLLSLSGSLRKSYIAKVSDIDKPECGKANVDVLGQLARISADLAMVLEVGNVPLMFSNNGATMEIRKISSSMIKSLDIKAASGSKITIDTSRVDQMTSDSDCLSYTSFFFENNPFWSLRSPPLTNFESGGFQLDPCSPTDARETKQIRTVISRNFVVDIHKAGKQPTAFSIDKVMDFPDELLFHTLDISTPTDVTLTLRPVSTAAVDVYIGFNQPPTREQYDHYKISPNEKFQGDEKYNIILLKDELLDKKVKSVIIGVGQSCFGALKDKHPCTDTFHYSYMAQAQKCKAWSVEEYRWEIEPSCEIISETETRVKLRPGQYGAVMSEFIIPPKKLTAKVTYKPPSVAKKKLKQKKQKVAKRKRIFTAPIPRVEKEKSSVAVIVPLVLHIICYLILLVIARMRDGQEITDGAVIELEDNEEANKENQYEIHIHSGSAMEAMVSINLIGSETSSGLRELKGTGGDDGRSLRYRGNSVKAFMMLTEKQLGEIEEIEVYINNNESAEFNGWMLEFIVVIDLKSMQRFPFYCRNTIMKEDVEGGAAALKGKGSAEKKEKGGDGKKKKNDGIGEKSGDKKKYEDKKSDKDKKGQTDNENDKAKDKTQKSGEKKDKSKSDKKGKNNSNKNNSNKNNVYNSIEKFAEDNRNNSSKNVTEDKKNNSSKKVAADKKNNSAGKGQSYVGMAHLEKEDPLLTGKLKQGLFSFNFSHGMKEWHLWLFCLCRPPRSPLTRVQRVASCAFAAYVSMLCSSLWLNSAPPESDDSGVAPLIALSMPLIVGISIAGFLASVLLAAIFNRIKLSKPEDAHAISRAPTKAPLPPACANIVHGVAMVIMLASCGVSALYALNWLANIAQLWLVSTVFSIAGDVCCYRPLYVLLSAVGRKVVDINRYNILFG